ncbi:hypothetical protein ACFWPP_00060 [Streptomyces anulatus]|uniref:hypothetical protein n=1 Tax=Streptomyces anulatus TaxID=1892 RepID=UPI00365D1FB9
MRRQDRPRGARWPEQDTGDWLADIAADQGFGITTTATADVYPYPGVAYLSLTGAPPVSVHLAWSSPPGHPAVLDLATPIRGSGGTEGCRDRLKQPEAR